MVFHRLWLAGYSPDNTVECLQCSQVAPWPGILEIDRIIEIAIRIGQVLMVRLKPVVRQSLNCQPEIPKRQVVFISKPGNDPVNALIAFQVVSFGG